jgi:adenine phosphoribosyltransferase
MYTGIVNNRSKEFFAMVYTMNIAGLTRDLKICPLNENLSIAGFVMFGDVELTEKCAAALLEKAPEFDVMITAESKGIPLTYEMARQAGMNRYILARKGVKAYMTNVVKHEVTSITTQHKQTLYLDGDDAAYMRGKRVLIVDDVISTGESLAALEDLVLASGGIVAGRMTVLAEGDAQERTDIVYLEKLPLFRPDGSVLG